MVNWIKVFILGISLLGFNLQDRTQVQAATIDIQSLALIEGELKQQTSGEVPGLAIGVVFQGETVYENYFGYADLQNRIKIGPSTRFNLAGNAKQFTALAVLSLQEQGKLKLDDDFRQYLPGYYPGIKSTISIRHLLTHRSGIRDFYDLLWLMDKAWWQQVGLDNKAMLALIKQQQTLNFFPGSEYTYSNSNYLLLAELVSQVSGKSFSDYCAEIFRQLKMPDSKFPADHMAIIPDLARPYSLWGEAGWREFPSLTSLAGDGYLYTSLSDQLLFESRLQNTSERQPLSALLALSQLRVPAVNDSETGEAASEQTAENRQSRYYEKVESYGYGIRHEKYKGLKLLRHSGTAGVYEAQVMRFPGQSLSIVIMTNSGEIDSYRLSRRIANSLLSIKSLATFPVRPEKLAPKPPSDKVTGLYRLGNGALIRISHNKDNLQREIKGRRTVILEHQEGNLYSYRNRPDLKIAFYPAASNSLQHQPYFKLFHPRFSARTARKLTAGDPVTGSLAGDWFNDELELTLTLSPGEDEELLATLNQHTHKLETMSVGLFSSSYHLVRYEQGKNGAPDSLWLTHGSNRDLLFQRPLVDLGLNQ